MNKAVEGEVLEREIEVSPGEAGALAMINRSEIDVQIATARKFPRSVTKFIAEATSLVALNETVADECIYSLPRDGKTIEGPSARFAEIMVYSWGNCRSGARVVDDQGEFVTAQGVHWDLEKNAAIGYEVKRRIVDKHGHRYKPDMIGVTANAACSIALRNAVLKGIPKALWIPMYETARKAIMGDFQTLANRRAVVLQNFQKFGVAADRVFEKLGVRGEEDISLEHIVTLKGMLNALKEGDSSPEEMFPAPKQAVERGAAAGLRAAVVGAEKGDPTKAGTAEVKHEAKAAEPKKAEPHGRPNGSPEILEKYRGLYKQARNQQELDDFANEASLYLWVDADQKTLSTAYHERTKELGAPKGK